MSELAELVARAKANDGAAERELLNRAGSGCIEAQRAIRDGLLADLNVIEALVLARMIAARGTVDDRHKLAASIFLLAKDYQAQGDLHAAADAAAEALGMFRDLADEGDGRSLQALAAMGPEFPAIMASLDCSALVPDGGPLVTEIAPPVIVRVAAGPLPCRAPTRWERVAIWWDDLVWPVRLKWWRACDWLKWGI